MAWWGWAFHVWQSKSMETSAVYCSVLHWNKFHPRFTMYFFTHISAMPGAEAAPLLEPSEHDRCLFFYWLSEHNACEFVPYLQLHQHPKSEHQPHVYCTGQFRWWFLCTVEPSVTPHSRDLFWEGGHGVKLSMSSNLGNVCWVRKINIRMDSLMLLFALPQAAVTWRTANQRAKGLLYWSEDATVKFILIKTY